MCEFKMLTLESSSRVETFAPDRGTSDQFEAKSLQKSREFGYWYSKG
jgi:hypothetical protein